MKKILIGLLSVIFLCSFVSVGDDISFTSIKLSGLKNYQGKNFTVYLSKGNFLGSNKAQVRKVFGVLGAGEISGDVMSLAVNKTFTDLGNAFQRPNVVTLVIHSSDLHALNSHRASRGIFALPEYLDSADIVTLKDGSQAFEERKSFKVEDVIQSEMISL